MSDENRTNLPAPKCRRQGRRIPWQPTPNVAESAKGSPASINEPDRARRFRLALAISQEVCALYDFGGTISGADWTVV
jgi:hypothetical protein